MNYEIVELKEKVIVGVSARTGNMDKDMGAVIGGLWSKLYQEEIYESIAGKVNTYAIGLYSDYEADRYSVTVGCEVVSNQNAELVEKRIPAGKYAKFFIHGDMVKAVAESWAEIWKLDLKRTFTGDFEEYLNCNGTEGDIAIYIAIE